MLRDTLFLLLHLSISLTTFHSLFAEDWDRVYLATAPRSGNHWVRELVETAAKIATGAVYRDKEPLHMNKIFPWGGYTCNHGYFGDCRYPTQDDTVFIKTHFPDSKPTPFDNLPYRSVIRIVRHPVDSFYSRYIKNPGGPIKNKVPSEKVKEYIPKWRRFQLYWNKIKKVKTFKYEEMLEDPYPALKAICKILNYDVADEDIRRAIEKHPPQGYMLKNLDKFHQSDLDLIEIELGVVMKQWGYTIPH